MEFALYGYSPIVLPSARSHHGKRLKDVGLVCKSWLQPVKQLMTQYEQETMEIHLKTGTQDDIAKVQGEVSTRGAAVRDLRVKIGAKSKYSYGDDDFFAARQGVGAASSGLERYLGQDARTETSGLEAGPLLSKHLPELLKAAGDHCVQLESLVLPRKPELKELMQGEKIETVLKTLYAMMEQIYVKGNRGGLRQLTVPTRNDAERHRSSTDFLDNVMKFCPNVEYLDGTDKACHSYDGVRCEDKWMVSLNTWEEFNKTCTKLREFQWTSVPFADPFFIAFSETPKPQLERLDITANLLWSWKEYLRVCGDETAAAIKKRHGRHASDAEVVLAACPALKNLKVEIDLQKYTDSAVRHLDIDMYGDDF